LSKDQSLKWQKQAPTDRYQKERVLIEQQQDSIKRQKRNHQEIEKQIHNDNKRIFNKLEEFVEADNPSLARLAISNQNKISTSRAQSEDFFRKEQEELSLQWRKLNKEVEEKEQQYKRDLQSLNNKQATKQQFR
jgi:hypothetical protein